MSAWLDAIKRKEELTPQIYLPEYFVCDLPVGKLYFNPFLDYGLLIGSEYERECISGYSGINSFLRTIRKIFYNKLYADPDPVYRKIKSLYIENNLELPDAFRRYDLINKLERMVTYGYCKTAGLN